MSSLGAEEPLPTACKGDGCHADVPALCVGAGRYSFWKAVDYCPRCAALRAPRAQPAPAPPPPPRDPMDPGPKPDPLPCVNDGCSNTVGFVLVEPGHSRFWVRIGPLCGPCVEAEKQADRRERFNGRLAHSGLPGRYARFTFDRVIVQQRQESIEDFARRVEACKAPHLGITRYNDAIAKEIRGWNPGRKSLFITGPVGGGKTTLVAALLHQLMLDDTEVLYLPEALLYDTVRQSMKAPRDQRRIDLPGMASRCRVLALDDLGTVEDLAPWQRNVIEQVICARYDANLPIIITSNLRLSDVAALHSERIASRLSEMCGRRQYELLGYDWRTGHQHAAPTTPAPAVPAGPKNTQLSLPTTPPTQTTKPRDYRALASGERDED